MQFYGKNKGTAPKQERGVTVLEPVLSYNVERFSLFSKVIPTLAQVIQIRLSQARLSSTVRPEREKFMSSKATEAVTMAAIVEMARIWVYTSCMISLALVHTSVAA